MLPSSIWVTVFCLLFVDVVAYTDSIANSCHLEAQKAHLVAWIRHGQAHQDHMDAFDQYQKHWGETLNKGLQSKLMDGSRYHLSMALQHEAQKEHHAEMAWEHKLNAKSGTGCKSTAASTAAAKKSAASAEESSSHTKTERDFLNLASQYEGTVHQNQADKLRKSALDHNTLWRKMPGKRLARHKLSKYSARAKNLLGDQKRTFI